MHRCLEVPELFDEIVNHVLDESSTAQHGDDRKSVANVALTCRAFYGGAMDALWRTLDDLAPLVKCMPGDLWEEEVICEEFGGQRHTLRFTRQPTEADWQRFVEHAHRVRSLFIGHEVVRWVSGDIPRTYAVDWSVLAALNEYAIRGTMGAPVFPRLRGLQCNSYVDPSRPLGLLACIPFLVGPALNTLHVSYGFQQYSFGSLGPLSSIDDALLSIISRCCFLAEVRLSTIGAPEAMLSPRALRSIMQRGRNVRFLHMDMPLNQDYLMALGTSTSLSKITATVECAEPSSYHLPPNTAWLREPNASFAALQDLSLRGNHLRSCSAALSLLPSETPLRTLKVRTGLWTEECEVQRFFASVSRFHSLESIAIEFCGPVRPNSECRTTFDALSQLFVLPNVTKFHLYHELWFSSNLVLDTFDVEKMGKAWPRLQDLRLQSVAFPDHSTHLHDMNALALFRENLPLLESLSLDVDASGDCSHIAKRAQASNDSHPLRVLDVSPKPLKLSITSSHDVAETLHKMFPKLERLVYGSYKDWGPVEACLAALPDSMLQSARQG